MIILSLLSGMFMPEAQACGNSMRYRKKNVEVKILSQLNSRHSRESAVEWLLERSFSDVQACLNKNDSYLARVKRLSYKLKISSSGTLTKSNHLQSTYSDSMENCIRNVLRKKNYAKALKNQPASLTVTFYNIKNPVSQSYSVTEPNYLSEMKLDGSYSIRENKMFTKLSFSSTKTNIGHFILEQTITNEAGSECSFLVEGNAKAISEHSLTASIHSRNHYCRLDFALEDNVIQVTKDPSCPIFTSDLQDCSIQPPSSIEFERKGPKHN